MKENGLIPLLAVKCSCNMSPADRMAPAEKSSQLQVLRQTLVSLNNKTSQGCQSAGQ